MSIIVYWLDYSRVTDSASSPEIHALGFLQHELLQALAKAEEVRKAGHRHVTISTELPDSVGKPGVAEVLPGYDWKKRRV